MLAVLFIIVPLVISTTSLGADTAKYWYDKAVVYSWPNSNNTIDLALKCINKSLAINNSDPIAWTEKGILLWNSNESIACFDNIVQEPSWRSYDDYPLNR